MRSTTENFSNQLVTMKTPRERSQRVAGTPVRKLRHNTTAIHYFNHRACAVATAVKRRPNTTMHICGTTASTRTSGERHADGEAGVRVAARAQRVGQEHSVEPAVDDAVSGAQRDTAAVADEVGQGVVSDHVHGLYKHT
jgi:hypothetical protein